MRLVFVSLFALACSESSFISYVPPVGEDGGAPAEPVDPPPSGAGGVAAGAGGTAGSIAGASGSTPKGGSAGSSGASGSAGTQAGSAGRAGSAGTSGTAGTGDGGNSQAGAPSGGAGSAGSAGTTGGSSGSAGTSSTSGEAGMAGSPEEPTEPRCRVRRMAPHDDQCLVEAIEGCPDVGLLIAPPGTCVWTSQQSDHDGCDSPSTFRSCQRLCAKDEPVSMVISFRNHLSAKIYLYNGPHPVCWDIPTQAFGAPCDEQCDEAAQKHEAYACHDVNCIENWSFAPSCEEPIPVGDDQNSCR